MLLSLSHIGKHQQEKIRAAYGKCYTFSVSNPDREHLKRIGRKGGLATSAKLTKAEKRSRALRGNQARQQSLKRRREISVIRREAALAAWRKRKKSQAKTD